MDGIKEVLSKPSKREAEITLIGGSSGYGECVVIHMGDGNWAVIDCCINPFNNKCIPIEYLNDIGVDIKTQLKYVLCTHWHEDHIRGLSELITQCGDCATFVFSCAEDRQKFAYEMAQEFDYTRKSIVLDELRETIIEVNKKNIKIDRVKQDKLIFKNDSVSWYALSPSENEITKLDAEIAQSQIRMNKVLKEIRSHTKTSPEIIDSAESYEREFWESIDGLLEDKIIVDENGDLTKTDSIIDLLDYKDANRVNKNIRSVAVLLTFGSHNAILGADLEVGQKDNGWHAVLSSQCLKNVQANAFKIPHHGSKTGYFQEFIDTHIKKGATSQLSPWINGSHKLPEPTTLKQYYDHSNNMFITTTSLLKSKNSETDRSIK